MSVGVSTDFLKRLSADPEATETTFRVMLLMVGKMDKRKVVEMTQQQMADAIGCSRESVCRALKKLRGMGAVHVGNGAVQFVDGVVALDEELDIDGFHGWSRW
jgi:CRP-like cAMP-binding protein